MSSTEVSSSTNEDASSEGSDARSVPCSLIDSSYSIVGSLIMDKNETVEDPPRDTEELEEDDGVDVIEEENVNENQGLLKGVQDLPGTDSGIHPEIYQGTEDQPSTTLIAKTGGIGMSSSGSDTTAKMGLFKRVAQAPLDLKMNSVIFIIITLLLAGYMQYCIDYKNEVLSQKIESMNSQLQRLQSSGSAVMSAYIKNQIELRHDLCPVFVEILQVVDFFVQTESPSGVIDACGKVILECLEYKTVEIGQFLEPDGLRLLESISAQQQKMDHWILVLGLLFDRWNTVHCTQEYVEQLIQLLDPPIHTIHHVHREILAQLAGGILCKCLDHEDVWDSNTEPTKKQVSEAVSKAIETWKVNYMPFDHIPGVVTWVKKSSETAQQHFAAWSLFGMTDMESSVKRRIRNVIEEVILEEILKDPRPHPHTKALIQQFLDK